MTALLSAPLDQVLEAFEYELMDDSATVEAVAVPESALMISR